jgi:hypothetical protein
VLWLRRGDRDHQRAFEVLIAECSIGITGLIDQIATPARDGCLRLSLKLVAPTPDQSGSTKTPVRSTCAELSQRLGHVT